MNQKAPKKTTLSVNAAGLQSAGQLWHGRLHLEADRFPCVPSADPFDPQEKTAEPFPVQPSFLSCSSLVPSPIVGDDLFSRGFMVLPLLPPHHAIFPSCLQF